jgi:hypothetical protein
MNNAVNFRNLVKKCIEILKFKADHKCIELLTKVEKEFPATVFIDENRTQ